MKRTYLQNGNEDMCAELLKVKGSYQWTGSAIELVEMVYGLSEMGSINNATTTVDPSKAMIGDVTQNGKVNLSDVVMLQKYLMGSYDLSDAQMKLADVTEDGNVTADDVTALMKSLLKITK